MVLFGQEGQFLSHLPLYRAPHDWQMLLRVRLVADSAGDPLAALRQDRAARGDTLYTIEPEDFSHSTLAEGMVFRATLFRGHFERGGTPIVRGAAVQVEEVLYRRRLRPGDRDPRHPRYLLLRTPGRSFLVHRIGGAPDFDQIVMVSGWVGLEPEPTLVPVVDRHGTGRLRPGQLLVLRKEGGAQEFPLHVQREIYLETGDLEGP
jgi:hypothetical protein